MNIENCTTRPWTLDIQKDGGNWEYSIREANPSDHPTIGKQICTMNKYLRNGESLAVEDNAELIVKAVNAYEPMLEALKDAKAWFEQYAPGTNYFNITNAIAIAESKGK